MLPEPHQTNAMVSSNLLDFIFFSPHVRGVRDDPQHAAYGLSAGVMSPSSLAHRKLCDDNARTILAAP